MEKQTKVVRTIGDAIKDMRVFSELTQAELAKRVGLSTITIRQYESGVREPRFSTLQQLAKAMNCNVVDILPSPNENAPYFRKIQENLSPKELVDIQEWDLEQNPEYRKEQIILRLFRMLNDSGKQTAIWRIEELTQIPKYQKENINNLNDAQAADPNTK